MGRMVSRLKRMRTETCFYCRSKKRRVSVGDCLEKYLDANAFEKQRSACWRCFQGKQTRMDFAVGIGGEQ
jgi:hypothetical protein